MKADYKQYTDNYSQYWCSKIRNILKQGLLQPLPVPERSWQHLSMDFIVDLPPSTIRGRTYCHILVMVDRLTKSPIYEPLMSLETEEVYEAMNCWVFCEHGLPASIVSNRGKQFVSYFW